MKSPAVILAVAAVALVGAGFAARGWAAQLSEQHDRIERLPVVHAPDFRKLKPGAEVLVAGTVADRNPVLFEGQVTLIRYRFAGTEPLWTQEQRQTPPLWLTATDGDVHLVNGSYRLAAPEAGRKLETPEQGVQHWQSQPDRVAGTIAATGFARGDRVLAYGKVQGADGVAQLDAKWVFGGTREQWLVDSARGRGVGWLAPWALWLLGALLGVIAFLKRA